MRIRRSITMLFALVTVAGAETGVWLPLDGYNTQYIDFRAPGSVNSFSYTNGKIDDPFYRFPAQDSGKQPLLSGRFQLGAETGDPLLNPLTDTRAFPNRDHRSFIGGEFRHPSLPLSCAGRYRYIDEYTDRFDSLWHISRSLTGSGMYNSNKGVAYEGIAMAHWSGDRLDIGIQVNPYGKWHATPFFFSPLLEEGLAIDGNAKVVLSDACTFESSYRCTRSQWYYDHTHGERFTDNVSKNSLMCQLAPHAHLCAEINYASLFRPELAGGFGGGYTDSLFRMGGILYGYSGGEVGGSLHAALTCGAGIRCSTSVTRDYLLKERGYMFLQNDTMVQYIPDNIAGYSYLGEVKWRGKAGLPIVMEGWVMHTTDPVEEVLRFGSDTIEIAQRTSNRLVRTFAGFSGCAKVTRGICHVSVRTGMLVPFGENKKVRFHCASFADATCEFSSRGGNPMRLGVSLHYNSRPQLTYAIVEDDENERRQTRYGEEWVWSSMSLRIPFLCLPLRSFLSSTAFILDAGPFSLGNKRRVQVHPAGNRIGAKIFAGFEGTIR